MAQNTSQRKSSITSQLVVEYIPRDDELTLTLSVSVFFPPILEMDSPTFFTSLINPALLNAAVSVAFGSCKQEHTRLKVRDTTHESMAMDSFPGSCKLVWE